MRLVKSKEDIVSPANFELKVPGVDIPTYIFSSENNAANHVAQFYDASSPNLNYDLATAELVVRRFAKGLQQSGLKPQDKVLLFSHNHLYFPCVLWGVLAAQCVFTGAPPGVSVFELSHQIKDSEAKIVLAAPEKLDLALKAATEAGLSEDKVFVFDMPGSAASLRSWTKLWASEVEVRDWSWKQIKDQDDAFRTTAVINYSSGTTGLPKGVELSHYSLIANVEQLIFKRARVSDSDFGRDRAARLDESGERWLAALPMYHAFGQTYYAMLAPRVGAKVFVMEKFNPVQYLSFIDSYRITFINVVPTILQILVAIPNHERFNLKSLVMVGSGSAPLPLHTAREFERLFLRPGVQVKQGWGMTETACNVTGFSPDDVDDGRSIGWLNPGCRARIVPLPDRDFSQVNDRKRATHVGEVWVSGPNIMTGYWKRPEETRQVLIEENGITWVRTGDVGYFDDRGCLFLVDRIKELIKVKGLQVSPAEIEKTLKSHEDVLDAAVIGVQLNGEESPRAFVVRKLNSTLTAHSLHSFAKQRLARHKWLTGGIYFMDVLPRTGSGKVIKRSLPSPDEKLAAKL